MYLRTFAARAVCVLLFVVLADGAVARMAAAVPTAPLFAIAKKHVVTSDDAPSSLHSRPAIQVKTCHGDKCTWEEASDADAIKKVGYRIDVDREGSPLRRKSWRAAPGNVRVDWPTLSNVSGHVADELWRSVTLRPELQAVLVYESGDQFGRHLDLCEATGQEGVLVVEIELLAKDAAPKDPTASVAQKCGGNRVVKCMPQEIDGPPEFFIETTVPEPWASSQRQCLPTGTSLSAILNNELLLWFGSMLVFLVTLAIRIIGLRRTAIALVAVVLLLAFHFARRHHAEPSSPSLPLLSGPGPEHERIVANWTASGSGSWVAFPMHRPHGTYTITRQRVVAVFTLMGEGYISWGSQSCRVNERCPPTTIGDPFVVS